MAKILRYSVILQLTGLSKSTVQRMVREGAFPQHVQLGKRAVGWHEADVIDWLEGRPRVDARERHNG